MAAAEEFRRPGWTGTRDCRGGWGMFERSLRGRIVGFVTVAFVAFLAGSVSSCSSGGPKSPAPPMGMTGEKKSLKALEGRWEGTFTNPVNRRTGTIVFDVFPGAEAHGDILMIPPDSREPLHPSVKPTAEQTIAAMPKVLEINFIEAEGNALMGTVGPFEDPLCQCPGRTTFRGTLSGDSISGTFQTEYLDSDWNPNPAKPITSGTWSVARVRKN
jgi:hypothetical protein